MKLSNYLGVLRDDPDDVGAYEGLLRLVQQRDPERLGQQPVRLLEVARQAHVARGEVQAVARLIEVEAELIDDDPEFAASLWKELGRLRSESLLDPAGAAAAYLKAQELAPDDVDVGEALKRLDQAEKSWRKFAKRFVDEAESATDTALKTSLFQRAGALVWQYRGKGRDKESDRLFAAALEADPGNTGAALLLEHTLREREQWDRLAELLLDVADNAKDEQEQVGFYARAGRVLSGKLGDPGRGAACYERVLDVLPADDEALAFLAGHYTSEERWDDLVAMYERALTKRHKLEVEIGILLQIGMVHWRMRGEAADAEPYFARLRKLDAGHPAMLDFYREHYAGDEGRDRWMAVLADAQRVASDDDAKLRMALEHAELARADADNPERAIDAWKLVQRLDPHNREATGALKQLYRAAEKWNALADVIKAEVEASEGDVQAQVANLRELLAIYRDRLHMDGMVINTLGRIIKLIPGDRDTLAELATKYESAGRWNDLINVLAEDAEAITDPAQKVEAYLRVAKLWIERFSNSNQATQPLEKVLELDPENREALLQLKSIYEKKRAWKPLYEVLAKERKVASDPAVRLANTIQMAELASDRLHAYGDAIELWRDALAQDPKAPGATEALEKLSEREKDWKGLVDVLEHELKAAESDDARIRVLQKLAALHMDKLEDPAGATRCWERILEIEPKHGRAMRAIRDGLVAQGDWDGVEKLYREVSDFEGLVDVLTHAADGAEDPDKRIDLSFRVARIFEDDIGEPARAVRSYERVLGADPANQRAAEKLVPLYEADEKWGRVRAMLDVQLGNLESDDALARIALLTRLRELCLTRLRDGDAGFHYAVEAYRLAPQAEDVREALEEAAEIAAAHERLAEVYRQRADTASGNEATGLRRRVAELAMDRLSQTPMALTELRKVLEAEPDDADVMATLERIYRTEQKTDDLHGLLQHRLERTDDDVVKRETLRELAQLEEEAYGDPDAAAARYRALSELDPGDREVLSARDRLATAGERWQELSEILQARLEAEGEPGARVELGARLGLLRVDKLDAPSAAIDAFSDVLAEEPLHGATVNALEKLADPGEDANEEQKSVVRRAQKMLEEVYEQGRRFDKLLRVLEARLETEKNEEEVRRLRLRLAEVSATELGDAAGAYSSLEAAFFEQPGDQELWDRLAAAAENAGHQRALANAYATAIEAGELSDDARIELAGRAAELYDEVLGQPEEAEPFHRRILEADPLAERSFLALKELYTGAERWDDLQALYRRRIADTTDGEAKLDLLLQVCFLFEEILDRPDAAIDTYQQVLELAPDHGAARRTLERLYEGTERWRDLAELLRGSLDQAEGQERVDLMLRLGDLCEHKLGEPAEAVGHYEGVLTDAPHQLRAQEALGRLLAVESQRSRVALILEPIYEEQGAYQDLARVLEIQLGDADGESAQADLLLRIGDLHENRTRDAEAAFSAFARAVEAEPDNGAARESLARVASSRETFRRERAQVLGRALEGLAGDDDRRDLEAELLLEMATLLDEFLEDREGAERAYQRLLEIEKDNGEVILTASRALERIHIEREDYAKLVEDLERQVEFENDDAVRVALLIRIADTEENMLERIEPAIAAHERRLELDPGDEDALRSLERLYEQTLDYAKLVDVLRRHAEVAEADEERRTLGRRAGAIREEHLEDPEGAIEAYADVVASFGPDVQTLAALARLYEAAERWQDLSETLQSQEELTEDAGERAALQFRMAELMRLHTGEGERALEYYEHVLEYEPTHTGALAALDAVMADTESDLRRDAARIAAPRYEGNATFDRLLAVLEVLQDTDDPADKLEALRRAAEVAENGLGDSSQAFDYAGRALRAGADDPAVGDLLAEVARLADASERHGDYVALLREVAPDIYDGDLQPEVYRRIAEVARERLQDVAVALEYYGKLREERPDDRDALDALEALNEQAGNHSALIEVLGQKAEIADDPTERARLLARQADIYERRLDDGDAAIGVLEELVIDHPTLESYESLERLYAAAGRWEDQAAAYEAQLDRGVGNAVDVRYKLARSCRERLDDTERAIEFLREAIAQDIAHAGSIELLESILESGDEHRPAAAELLEPVYLSQSAWSKLTSALEARIEVEDILEDKKRLLVRLAQLYEDQLEDFEHALEVYARLFHEDPREEETWETLGRLARVGEQWSVLGKILRKPLDDAEGAEDEEMAKLARHAGRLYAERIGNQHQAAELFAMALAFDPADREAFDALERSYRELGAWEKLLPLYREQADAAETDERRVDLLHRAAHLHREMLQQSDEAVGVYREILEVEPDNSDAIDGLEHLLTQAEDWSALGDHLRVRIDQTLGSDQEIPLKIRLAELLEEKLEDTPGAIDVYEEISQLNAQEKHMLWALERLVQDEQHTLRITQILEPIYRQLDQWKKLVAVYEAQVNLVEDEFERGRLLGEIGELHEQRAGDVALAFHAWMRAFVLDPDSMDARGHVDRLAAQMGAWDEHVQAYESAIAKTDDDSLQSQLLTTIARVHDEKRGDPRAAIAVYERLADHDPDDPSALDSLEALLTMVGDWEGMARLLERRAERAMDTEERGEMLRRLGSIQEELLGDRDAAINAYTRAAEEDDTDALAYEALDRLYSLAQQPDDLGRVLKQRIELSAEPGERVSLGLRLGALFDQELRNPESAIESYQRVLDDEPVNAPALTAMGNLLEKTGRFTDLLDNLETRTSLAPDDASRVRLLNKAGAVLENELNDPYEAIERYRQVLEIDPSQGAAIDALIRITKLPEHRTQAAEILEPLLRAQARWDDLVQLIEDGVGQLEDPFERRGELVRLAEVHEHGRGNPADAFTALCRALREEPDENLLADVERLARELGSWGELADVLSERAPQLADATMAADLYRRLGRICEENLGDDARAIEAFVHASEHDDDSTETLVDLDRLYTRAERWEALLDVVDRRVAATGEPAERTDLLVRLGNLREERFDDGRGAYVAFKEVLDSDPAEPRALEGMERLGQRDALAQDVLDTLDDCYRQTGALDKVAGLYDIRIRLAETDAERMRLLREAAGVWENELGDPARALQSVRRVFELDPLDGDVLNEAERLAEAAGSYEGLRGMIDGLAEAGIIEGQHKRLLCARAAAWYRDRIPDPAAEERCLRWILEVDGEQAHVHERLCGLLRAPGREKDLVEALRRWAEVEHDPGARKERLREAAVLAESAVGDAATAAECYESLLGTDPEDREALSELSRIRFDAGEHAQSVDLLGRLLAVTEDIDTRVSLRYRTSEIQAQQLDDAAAAIETLQALLGEAPDHGPAVAALDAAFQKAERWQELRALLGEQLERSDDPAARTDLRVRLARLSEAQLGDRDGAIAELNQILAEQPGHELAQDELERLYELDERFGMLAELLTKRADAAGEAGDTARELALLHRVAKLTEEQLQDGSGAAQVYGRIHERDASDMAAIEALLRLAEAGERWADVVRYMNAQLALQQGAEAVATACRLAEVADGQLGDVDQAEAALQRALELQPGDADARERLKALYEKHGQHAKLAQALAEEEPALEDAKERVALLNRIAGLYRDELSDPGAAVGYLERAVELVPDDREALLALCDLYIAAERQRDAIPVLEKIVESYGGRRAKEVAVYQHRLGQAYEGIGEVEEALARYDAAFKIDLTNVLILRDLGRLCLEKGDLERAQKSYRALLLQKLGPDSGIHKADVYFRLGDISFRQGDKVKAKAMLERAISEAGEHPEAAALLEQLG